jgi:hypothetical protein
MLARFHLLCSWGFIYSSATLLKLQLIDDLLSRQRALDSAIRVSDSLPEDLATFRSEYRSTFKSARRTAEKRIGASLSTKARSHTTFWDLVQKLRSPSCAVATDADTVLNHFRSVLYDPNEPLFFDPSTLGIAAPPNFEPKQFSDAELVKALNLLNAQAATGPQRVVSRYIKNVFQNKRARILLLFLMNWCFRMGIVPTKWGDSEVFILYKGKGDVTDPINYRGINLNKDFLCLYERLLNDRMQTWLSLNCPWGIQQFGFSKGVSTENAFLCLESIAGVCTRVTKVPLFATFVDLQRAFPSMLRSKALHVLNSIGLPFELLRAFASTFSGNTFRLHINDQLTQMFFVNRGTKERGINSPSIFNTVYAFLLRKLGVSDFPENARGFDPENVYYLVFADDLVLLGANLTKLENIMVDLNKVLDDLGMKVNSGKTKWLAYLPNKIIPTSSLSNITGFRYGQGYLENVDFFKYLGFLSYRNSLMFLTARMMGKLLRSLEVTDFRSLRAYFYSLVGSQRYSMSVISFDEDSFEKAQKIFLQEVFNLPPSFAKYMAKFLLGVEDFLLLSFDARVRFLQRIATGSSESSLNALIMDRELLMPLDVGWNSGFVSLFPDHIEITDFDLSDSGDAAAV